ncbi:hypothetical protein [Burkholderia pseudomultivorans]|uniref:hypothetical protein n=1 Tax=Burkholderia pseudomultivorans TaxID=1207504 RepID=UPI0012D90646|nr:hypothetical protein [Burkholderia pseudomultivorans]MBF5014288.1 hypothetical protein [Burkholderia pseudomultivorans]
MDRYRALARRDIDAPGQPSDRAPIDPARFRFRRAAQVAAAAPVAPSGRRLPSSPTKAFE